MKTNVIFSILISVLMLSCNGHSSSGPKKHQAKKGIIGGSFENGEFLYIGMPQNINAVDTSRAWNLKGQKLLISGKIYKSDGKTVAPNVILYYYHTDDKGLYTDKPDLDRRVVRHGYIRGWVKSDTNGNYAIYTTRPAPYPNSNMPAHIHPAVKEPNLDKEYYIDEFVFDDDTLLIGDARKKLENRGGSGILRVYQKNNLQIAEHNIILGLNIPNYPEAIKEKKPSGLQIGEDQPSFLPYHAFGPDKDSRTCPVCKYGRYHGILYFVGNNPNWNDIKKWLSFLEQESIARSNYLKVYFVYGNSKDYSKAERKKQLEKIGTALNLKNTALTFVPSFEDTESEANLNKINPNTENTFIIYRNRNIIDKYINFKPTPENFKKIINLLDQTKSDYFFLKEPHQ